jgi:DNA-binding MurR/RpiR family transcriptional regulator
VRADLKGTDRLRLADPADTPLARTIAKERGARTIVVTDSPFSALRGDVGLHAPAESASFVAFHAAPLILINTLIDAVARANPERAAEALAAFESLAERERYFQAA